MGFLSDWPPTPDDYYLELDPAHPLFQGDVFDDVPFVKVRAGNSVEAEPNIDVERRRVCALLYPCDMYNEVGVLARVQAVAIVRELTAGERFPADWNGSFNLFPYPGLAGDDATWIADFRTTANVDRSYLRADRRVASLSMMAWAYFRQRITLNYTRANMRLARLIDNSTELWTETMLWQEWSQARGSTEGFQKWYDTSSTELTGFCPRVAVSKQGMLLDVQEIMRAELAE